MSCVFPHLEHYMHLKKMFIRTRKGPEKNKKDVTRYKTDFVKEVIMLL